MSFIIKQWFRKFAHESNLDNPCTYKIHATETQIFFHCLLRLRHRLVGLSGTLTITFEASFLVGNSYLSETKRPMGLCFYVLEDFPYEHIG